MSRATRSTMPLMRRGAPRRDVIAALVLFLLVAALYSRVLLNDYVGYDDPDYVAENAMVQKGLTSESVAWAFTATHAANWHPLTWLSHMLDWQLHGNDPGRHHFTSVLLHAGNAVLLFFLMRAFGGGLWTGVAVAGLFALHPLRVESVAWLAERKDVLSTFFGLLSISAYVARFGPERRSGAVCYGTSLLLFACSLMSKPMFVTLPFVLLLLDGWPLRRIPGMGPTPAAWARVLAEKVPFFLLSFVSCVVTLLVQSGKTVQSLAQFSVWDRVSNVLVNYGRYLWKSVWPVDLAFFYPLVKAPPLWQAALAAAALGGLTWLVVRAMRTRPYLATGWFWYLGTLVPVVGIVHVGEQSHADRYTYVPSIGILIALAWAGAEWVRRRPGAARILAALSVMGMLALSVMTWRQIGFWKNNRVMLERALAVTKDNFLAYNNYGVALAEEERFDEAIEHYQSALRVRPGYARAYDNLGAAFTMKGDFVSAVENYRVALSLRPNEARTHHNLAVTLGRMRDYEQAIFHCREALRLDPRYYDAHYDLGLALLMSGRVEEALPELEDFVRHVPEDALGHYQLGVALARKSRFPEAMRHYREAVRLKPDLVIAVRTLAWLLATSADETVRNGPEAERLAEQAVRLSGRNDPSALAALAAARAESGRFEEAVQSAEEAMDLARRSGRETLVSALESQLALYRSRRAVRGGGM